MYEQGGSIAFAEWKRLARVYDLEGYLFEVVSQRVRDNGKLSAADFFAIIIWKSNRTKTKIKRGLASAGLDAESLTAQVAETGTPESKLAALTRVAGIGLPMASAILTVCYPDEFTVFDYRAWATLRALRAPGLPNHTPNTARAYLQYCEACRSLAERVGLSLRDLDRALWAKSWEDDLHELVGHQ